MTKDTPTPRTDALVEANRGKPCSQSVDCDFARELERDLTACRAALNLVYTTLDSGVNVITDNDETIFVLGCEERGVAMRAIAEVLQPAARAILQSTGEGEGK